MLNSDIFGQQKNLTTPPRGVWVEKSLTYILGHHDDPISLDLVAGQRLLQDALGTVALGLDGSGQLVQGEAKMRKFVLSLLALVALASLADASGLFCRRCRRCHAVGVPCAVAVPAVVAPVTEFVPIQVPTYSVTYTPIVQQITRQETYTTVPMATQVKTTVQEQTYGPPATVLFQASGQQVQGVSQVTGNYQAQSGVQSAAVVQGQVKQAVPQPSAAVDQPDKVEAALLEFLESRKRLKQIEANLANCFNPTPVPPTTAPSPPTGAPGAPVAPPAGTPAPKPDTGPMALGVFNKSCAVCHDSKVAATNGKGFTLLQDGKIAPLNANQLLKVMTKTYLQEMPKQPNLFGIKPLTDEEVGAVVAYVKDQQK